MQSSSRVPPCRRSRVAGFAMALLLTAAPVAATAQTGGDEQPNGATIQWAQQILDDQGFYQGRAHGRMDAATAAAITAYQRKNGLKPTGRLDRATIDKMLETREPPKTVGNLADPNSRARSSGPMLREEEVRPQAAPSAPGVERGEGAEQSTLGGPVSPGAAPGPPAPAARPAARVEAPAGGEGAQPTAAPRSSVAVEGGESAGTDLRALLPMNVVRYALLGIVGVIVLGMAFVWWSGGRRSRSPAKTRRAAPAAPGRAEPTLGRKEPGLRADPGGGLRAGRR